MVRETGRANTRARPADALAPDAVLRRPARRRIPVELHPAGSGVHGLVDQSDVFEPVLDDIPVQEAEGLRIWLESDDRRGREEPLEIQDG